MKIDNIKFYKSNRKGKKYKVSFTYMGKNYNIHFGSSTNDQYRDDTPLKLFSKRNHLDKERRRRYYLRHGSDNNDPTTPKFWSHRMLWSLQD